jgi:plasmid stability protein
MSDILLRNVPPDLKKQIEARAREHKHSLSREIELLLERALVHAKMREAHEPGGLGTALAGLIKEEDWTDAFVIERDDDDREPPDFS